ncbi:MAG: DUF1361 domain-containing protein [Acholeplasmataceae bacterium]|nr:DUF1361 domain-containing protein [Acholeplasmataceae bacterium]
MGHKPILDSKIHPIYIVTILYIVFSIFLGLILKDSLVVFLGWNLSLALFVFLIKDIFIYAHKRHAKKGVLFIILGLYVLFFPNTIYVLTDFIHFQNYAFFENYPSVYVYELSNWFVFAHILIGALLSVKLGIQSIIDLKPTIEGISKKGFHIGIHLLFLLSSIAIFIGRFLRFNSWQILSIFRILGELFGHGLFALGFIVMFYIIHWGCYFLWMYQSNRQV